MSAGSLIAVFIGGGLGSLCRYGLSLLIVRNSATLLPWATLAANVLSCIVMALALGYFANRVEDSTWLRLFLLVGFCGGFSTFSTFSLENFLLIKEGQFGFLIANIAISVLLCIGVFWLLAREMR